MKHLKRVSMRIWINKKSVYISKSILRMEKKNTFTIMGSGIGFSGGRYKNYEPSDAAKKAGKALFKQLEDPKFRKYKNKTVIRFILRKKDRRSAGKTYAYEVSRTKLKNPIVVKRGNAEYTINYDYHIKSCSMDATEVKKMTGGCLGCAIGGNRNMRKGGYNDDTVSENQGANDTDEYTGDTQNVGVAEDVGSVEDVEDAEDAGDDEGDDNAGAVGDAGDAEGDNALGDLNVMTGGKKKRSTKNTKNANNTRNTRNAKNANKTNKKK